MIHLHAKSCYSLLESPLRPQRIVQLAKENQMSAAVLTDRNVMSGTMAFLHACRSENIKPIIGLEVSTFFMEEDLGLILLAKNQKGLESLYALSTQICTSDDEKADFETIRQHADNLIVLTCGIDTWQEVWAGQNEAEPLIAYLQGLQDAFENFYVSIALNDSSRQRSDNAFLKTIAHSLDIETVALNRVEYEKPEDVEKLKLLRAIDMQTTLLDPKVHARKGRYFRSPKEMEALYDGQDLQTTDQIAAMIDLQPPSKASLPVFVNKLSIDGAQYLTKLCKAGLYKRTNNNPPAEYQQRLEYELSVILQMGFENYFLIVWDFIRYARSQKILVGPGRGSAAGSLVAYCLGITHIDPVANQLLFERFLNPERISMPDIDTDFPDDKRDEVIRYVYDLYGHAHVAHIVTFSSMKARMVLRDVGRAMQMNPYDVDRLCKLLSAAPNQSLQQAYETNKAFHNQIRSKKQYQQLYQMALGIEGLPRHASIHAGGIVFSKEPLQRYAPLMYAGSDIPAVQFTMEYLEELGLIKFDFLGIKNLSALEEMRKRIEERVKKPLDLFRIPLDDSRTYQLLSSGNTLGVFQLESSGIRHLLREFKPERFEDVAAVLALYRPGPMENIDLYLKARRNPRTVVSLHPLLDDLLRESGGIFLYQEQIMKAAQIIGGFSLSQADSLRKAMSKKNHDIMSSYRKAFIQGAATRGIGQDKAREIFDVMERFADYGFNKSHSYAYGLVVYWMAWIKANFPLEFYEASLNSCMSSQKKSSEYIMECRLAKIPVYGVSLNHSFETYTREGGGFRMPFSLIKGFPSQVYRKIIEERNAGGPYTDLPKAFARLCRLAIGKASLQSLVYAGAFDEFGYGRKTLVENLDRLIQYGMLVKENVGDHGELFNYEIVSEPVIYPLAEDEMENLSREYDLFGFYVSMHPAAALRKNYPKCIPVMQAKEQSGYMELAGRITNVKTHKTKRGDMMAFASLEDETGQLDLAIMPGLFAETEQSLQKNAMVWIFGKKDRKDSILVNSLRFVS